MQLWPFKVIAGFNDNPMILVNYRGQEKSFSAEEISSMILRKMREIAEKFLETPIENAVITVPAYFNDSQRKATIDAGTIAGLNVKRIINEPTAAALAYGLQKRPNFVEDRNIFIFDLGGGTFDVSLLTIKNNVFHVKAVAGDTHLGGEDFDNRMMNHFVEEIKRKNKVDISGNPGSLRRLRTSCERAKRILSFAVVATVEVNALFQGIELSSSITRAKFEMINIDLFEKCMEIVRRCFVNSGMDKSCVDDVVLIGGSSRIPKLQQLLQDFFNGKDLCMSINPDEAVAYGAAVQAAMLNVKYVPNLTLRDVIPLSLGTSEKGDIMDVVIPRNTSIPITKKKTYFTDVDNQSRVSFKVYEGESIIASENNLLGVFSLSLPHAPRGLPIQVYFAIDADGILNLSAEEETSGTKRDITVTHETESLSTEEPERMIQEAENFNVEDKKPEQKAKAMNDLNDYLYHVRQVIANNDVSSLISPVDKLKIYTAVVKGQNLLDGNKDEETHVLVDFLKEFQSMVDSALYKITIGI
ncbi:heat shock cognate 70 kDa protein 2-like [Vicia villosa]|uniref:heat shock cognate 70 kDa protein 2-like n=1 Tax=Vicia villosa TaxID=3911 RepID=UPI00273C3623|nr:heat shock cognate 70 kDa protein 2-like [Vicia villosa]